MSQKTVKCSERNCKDGSVRRDMKIAQYNWW